ncbi:hypothetical protein TSO352_17255 [Azospirillum sp. TSO35-2]|nr:hypothetical protein TSO352_17255 [Azospirillum sp. TSO35-2]
MSLFPDPVVEHRHRALRLERETINDGQQRDRLHDATADRIVPQRPARAGDRNMMIGWPPAGVRATRNRTRATQAA